MEETKALTILEAANLLRPLLEGMGPPLDLNKIPQQEERLEAEADNTIESVVFDGAPVETIEEASIGVRTAIVVRLLKMAEVAKTHPGFILCEPPADTDTVGLTTYALLCLSRRHSDPTAFLRGPAS